MSRTELVASRWRSALAAVDSPSTPPPAVVPVPNAVAAAAPPPPAPASVPSCIATLTAPWITSCAEGSDAVPGPLAAPLWLWEPAPRRNSDVCMTMSLPSAEVLARVLRRELMLSHAAGLPPRCPAPPCASMPQGGEGPARCVSLSLFSRTGV